MLLHVCHYSLSHLAIDHAWSCRWITVKKCHYQQNMLQHYSLLDILVCIHFGWEIVSSDIHDVMFIATFNSHDVTHCYLMIESQSNCMNSIHCTTGTQNTKVLQNPYKTPKTSMTLKPHFDPLNNAVHTKGDLPHLINANISILLQPSDTRSQTGPSF